MNIEINTIAVLHSLPSQLALPIIFDSALLYSMCPQLSRRFVSHDDPIDYESEENNAVSRALTWLDEKVKAARVKRDKVTVTVAGETKEFSSCAAAFEQYGLPIAKCARFRGKLKQAQAAVFTAPDGVEYIFGISGRTH